MSLESVWRGKVGGGKLDVSVYEIRDWIAVPPIDASCSQSTPVHVCFDRRRGPAWAAVWLATPHLPPHCRHDVPTAGETGGGVGDSGWVGCPPLSGPERTLFSGAWVPKQSTLPAPPGLPLPLPLPTATASLPSHTEQIALQTSRVPGSDPRFLPFASHVGVLDGFWPSTVAPVRSFDGHGGQEGELPYETAQRPNEPAPMSISYRTRLKQRHD